MQNGNGKKTCIHFSLLEIPEFICRCSSIKPCVSLSDLIQMSNDINTSHWSLFNSKIPIQNSHLHSISEIAMTMAQRKKKTELSTCESVNVYYILRKETT